MDLNILYLFLILCHLKPFKTDKIGQAIPVEDFKKLFDELGQGHFEDYFQEKPILREKITVRTVVPEIDTTTILVTKINKEIDDKFITKKDLETAINDLEQRLTARLDSLQSKLTSSGSNQNGPNTVYNLMDFIKLGRGERLSPKPRTDNLNWLKIKVPYTK